MLCASTAARRSGIYVPIALPLHCHEVQNRVVMLASIAQVGVASLTLLDSEEFNPNILPQSAAAAGTAVLPRRLQDLWQVDAVVALSHHDAVERVVALGTVLAVELKVPPGQGGYSSNVARKVTDRLRRRSVYARPLGNVVYLMCTPTSDPASLRELVSALLQCLAEEAL